MISHIYTSLDNLESLGSAHAVPYIHVICEWVLIPYDPNSYHEPPLYASISAIFLPVSVTRNSLNRKKSLKNSTQLSIILLNRFTLSLIVGSTIISSVFMKLGQWSIS